MPRVVPSQVVTLIDKMFPVVTQEKEDWHLTPGHANHLVAIIDMVDQIPQECLILDVDPYTEFTVSMAAIRQTISRWEGGDRSDLKKSPGYRVNPVTLIRRALVRCPDEYPAPETTELDFIEDWEFRDHLRLDISSVNKALSNGEWKAATVLAGSVSESLLLWRLQQVDPNQITHSLDNLVANGTLSKQPDATLEKWDLYEYIVVAKDLKVVTAETATQAMLAKGFRNLIHPGRQLRLGQACNRATALSAVAAVEFIVEDLKPLRKKDGPIRRD